MSELTELTGREAGERNQGLSYTVWERTEMTDISVQTILCTQTHLFDYTYTGTFGYVSMIRRGD